MSDSLRPHGLHSPWNSPGQNPGVGSLSLLQGIFPTQGSNPGLPHCRRILYLLSHKRICSFIQQIFREHLPPSLGDLPHPEIELQSPALQADYLLSEPPGKPREHLLCAGCASNAHCRRYTIAVTKRDTKMIKSQSPLLLRRSLGRGG